MTNPWEWAESDLIKKIAENWKEAIDLEFKGSDSLQDTDGKKNVLSKDVSAFANSAGGVIIYGVTIQEE
jgi:predicted HTH transcriptional regulator